MMIKLVVNKNDSNQTLINFLKKTFKDAPLSQIYHLFYKKKIKVNSKRVTNFKYLVQENDVIYLYDNKLVIKNKSEVINPNLAPEIIYQDQNIVVVIKDHGITIHSPSNQSLDNIVRYYLAQKEPELFNSQTFTISHLYRLDKLTKGLVVYPKTKLAQQNLIQAQLNNNITKKYLAVCQGNLKAALNLNGFIYHDEKQEKMIFTKDKITGAKSCQTMIKPLKMINDFTLVECQLITGRKHQIRASLAYLKLPIVGDQKYGSIIIMPKQIMLFAYYLSFQNLVAPLEYLNKKIIVLPNLQSQLEQMMVTKFNIK
ncbi:RluA family pseudouridine synthase [Spiroplasma attinicola]|uniref:RluA family pseudouridine synthase n=1 Tax=Spiroplasma attinicola TaxID=2904537 RepID=UPI002022AD4C|nr:RluA family pseudouridine synthase [Spiroplasma sp. JKS002670]MCL8209523.1 Ribosomal large subunit pseudouridine synthase C [Spiroplasma sp. JKS002670]